MIQIIDSFLKARLERRRATRVRSDARISTGLSKPFMLDWVTKAREQARSVHPDVTVMFIGANDGFPMKTRSGASMPCCGAAWTAEYARRVASMMRSYLRGGRSYVYWMTLPTPRRDDFARIYRSVNRAIRRRRARVGRGARVIDLVKVFTPGGRFRQYVRFRGKTVERAPGRRRPPVDGRRVDRRDAAHRSPARRPCAAAAEVAADALRRGQGAGGDGRLRGGRRPRCGAARGRDGMRCGGARRGEPARWHRPGGRRGAGRGGACGGLRRRCSERAGRHRHRGHDRGRGGERAGDDRQAGRRQPPAGDPDARRPSAVAHARARRHEAGRRGVPQRELPTAALRRARNRGRRRDAGRSR